MVSIEVHGKMAAHALVVFLGIAMSGAMAFAMYILCFVAWHHLRIKQKSSRLLFIHDILELISISFTMLGFLTNLQYFLPFFLAYDFAIAAWICFDVLHGHFFSDKPQYKSVITKPGAFLLGLWAISHFIVGIYDVSQPGNLRYTLPGLLFLGVSLLSVILHHEMIEFRSQRDYVMYEIDRVGLNDKWKVVLVSKQYKFIYLQFPVHIVGYLVHSVGLVLVVIDGVTLLAVACFAASTMLFMIGKGCQLLGFFHPVPQWKAAIEGG